MFAVRSRRKSAQYDDVPGLSLYRSAPALDVRLEEFELFAIDRLRVHKRITDGLSRGKKHEEMEKLVSHLWKANMRHPQASEVISKDIISHFVLRLVYCTTEDLRKWCLSMQTTLFRYRFRNEKPGAQRSLMAEFGLLYKKVDSSELEVRDNCEFVNLTRRHKMFYFKGLMPNFTWSFEEVPELEGDHRVFISKGHAYVAMSRVVSLVATHFCSHLSKALMLSNRNWTSSIAEQEKNCLTPIVEALSTSYLGPDYSQPKEFAEISLRGIDKIAKSSYPLCMCHLFEKLREEHHLKHGRRMQMGLILKGVGLKLDHALAFWKAEFSRKDYTPYSCQKIISSTPGVGDHHGCPYRHFSEENLTAALSRMGVSSRAVGDVMDNVRNKHYQNQSTAKDTQMQIESS